MLEIQWGAALCSLGENRAASIIEWGLSIQMDTFKGRKNPTIFLNQVSNSSPLQTSSSKIESLYHADMFFLFTWPSQWFRADSTFAN